MKMVAPLSLMLHPVEEAKNTKEELWKNKIRKILFLQRLIEVSKTLTKLMTKKNMILLTKRTAAKLSHQNFMMWF